MNLAQDRAKSVILPLIGVLYRPIFKIFLLVSPNVGLDMHMHMHRSSPYDIVLFCMKGLTLIKNVTG
jgi:hypothetical protein